MPEGRGPGLGDRRVARGEAGDERRRGGRRRRARRSVLAAIDFEELAVGLEAGELVGRGLGGPAGLALADGAAVGGGGGRRRRGRRRAAGSRRSPRRCRPRGRRARRRASGLSPPGKRDLEARPWRCRAAGTRRRGPGRARSTAGADASALGRTETSTRPGTSPTSQRTVCRQERSRSLSAGSSRVQPPPPEVADHQGRRRAPCRTAGPPGRGRALPAASRDLGQDHGPRLDVARRG